MQLFIRLQRNLEAKARQAHPENNADRRIARSIADLLGSTFMTETADTLANPKIVLTAQIQSMALVASWYVMFNVSGNAAICSFGSLLLASGLASFFSSPFWERYSDRSSRWVIQVSALWVALLGLLTVTIYWFVPNVFDSLWLVPLLYCVLQIAHQGVRVARKTYVVDLANDGNRVDYVSISNTRNGAIILMMGLVSGLLSIWLPPIGMIVLFSMVAGIGAWTASSLPAVQECC